MSLTHEQEVRIEKLVINGYKSLPAERTSYAIAARESKLRRNEKVSTRDNFVSAGFGRRGVTEPLAHVSVDVTLIDRSNYHTFQLLFYEAATYPAESRSTR